MSLNDVVLGPGNNPPEKCPKCGKYFHRSVEVHNCPSPQDILAPAVSTTDDLEPGRATPTLPGYYWVSFGDKPFLTKVCEMNGNLVYVKDLAIYRVDAAKNSLWYGPIQPPT